MLRRGFDPGRGRENDVEGSRALGEPRAAPRCIPSARVQPQTLDEK